MIQENILNSRPSETVDCSSTSGSELFHARERCAVRHSCQVLYFFQNNVVPQFFNGMLRLSSVDLWLCTCVQDNKTVSSCLFREQSKLLSLGAGDAL